MTQTEAQIERFIFLIKLNRKLHRNTSNLSYRLMRLRLNQLRQELIKDDAMKQSVKSEPSQANPGYLNVMIEADSRESCQGKIFSLEDQIINGRFINPLQAADGTWVSWGQVIPKQECLELTGLDG